jgi:4-diphosphocytidyl-2-C-methyl-D-erythritol kinase
VTRSQPRSQTQPQTWPAPAKINLFLHVLGRRPDGYHELQTCFQFIDRCDEVAIEVRSDGEVMRGAGALGVPPEADLCVRAARALKAATGSKLGAHISVRKRIPVGAGLGGGSSDAATCLLVLNELWNVRLSTEELARIGLTLGADVPVFVHGRAAFGEGVGERLTPLDPPLAPPEDNYLIIKPNVFVSTKEVFQDPELTRNSPPITIHGFLASGGRNDCLEVVRRRYPEVARAIDWLSAFGAARLTGTGACIFMACEETRAAGILEQLPAGCEGFLARGLNTSPLISRLGAVRAGGV